MTLFYLVMKLFNIKEFTVLQTKLFPTIYIYWQKYQKKLLEKVKSMSSGIVLAAKLPESLNRQFPERLSRDEAIKHQKGRKRARTELIPSDKLFLWLHVSLYNKANPC